MPKNILTVRATAEELAFLQHMIDRGKFHSKSEAIREGLRILREREEPALRIEKASRSRPSYTIDGLAREFSVAWLTREDSGEIVESIRER